jgi:hypothetical protein
MHSQRNYPNLTHNATKSVKARKLICLMKSKIVFESTKIKNSEKIINNLNDKHSRMKTKDYTIVTTSER